MTDYFIGFLFLLALFLGCRSSRARPSALQAKDRELAEKYAKCDSKGEGNAKG